MRGPGGYRLTSAKQAGIKSYHQQQREREREMGVCVGWVGWGGGEVDIKREL